MQTPKTTRNWAIAAAVAAMLTASTAAVRAQDATPATPAAVVGGAAPMAPSTGSMTSGSMASGSMSSGTMDYSLLNNPNYDYVDLQQAKARGLSDSQIATIAKIAQESYVPFNEVARAVERGQTFPSLAGEYNLKLADVYDVDKEKQQIADYNSVYESLNMKNGSSSGMMGGGMDNSMPMAPAPAPMPAPADSSTAPAMATMDIVDTAIAAKNLTTLVKALQTAGLVETLKGAGPFTVFAPDDKAFSRLPAGQLDALLADPVKLKTILTYHVIPASIMASDAMNMTSPTSPPTVQGGTLQVTKGRKGRLKINDATVIKADIKASNGIIHIIDRVLIPPMDAAAPAAGADTTATPPAMAPAVPAPVVPAPAQ